MIVTLQSGTTVPQVTLDERRQPAGVLIRRSMPKACSTSIYDGDDNDARSGRHRPGGRAT